MRFYIQFSDSAPHFVAIPDTLCLAMHCNAQQYARQCAQHIIFCGKTCEIDEIQNHMVPT